MGVRYRKSFNLGHGFRINLSKSGIGYSWGTKGFRTTKTAKGTTRNTYSIPGTGFSYVSEHKNQRKDNSMNQQKQMRYSSNECPFKQSVEERLDKIKTKHLTKSEIYSILLPVNLACPPIILVMTIILLILDLDGEVCTNVVMIAYLVNLGLNIVMILKHLRKEKQDRKIDAISVMDMRLICLSNNSITIKTKSVQQYNMFDMDKIIDYLKNNIGELYSTIDNTNDNINKISMVQNELSEYLDSLISNNETMYLRDANRIRVLTDKIISLYDRSKLQIVVEYISPAGRNHYAKRIELSPDDVNTIIDYINKLNEEDSVKNKTKNDKQKVNQRELELIKALSLFMLEIPFSKEELKSQRNRLIKSFHPDSNNGDNASYAIKINDAYELLMKYATD